MIAFINTTQQARCCRIFCAVSCLPTYRMSHVHLKSGLCARKHKAAGIGRTGLKKTGPSEGATGGAGESAGLKSQFPLGGRGKDTPKTPGFWHIK